MTAIETPLTAAPVVSPVAAPVSCRLGADPEWREFHVVCAGDRCVTLEPVESRGDLHRVSGDVLIRFPADEGDAAAEPVEVRGTVRHRSWIAEGRFGIGVEVTGFELRDTRPTAGS